jgi:hypothetical protein
LGAAVPVWSVVYSVVIPVGCVVCGTITLRSAACRTIPIGSVVLSAFPVGSVVV